MMMWFRKRAGQMLGKEAADNVVVEPMSPPRPIEPPTWRVVKDQHTGAFLVQRRECIPSMWPAYSTYYYVNCVKAGRLGAFDVQEEAEAWIEREIAGSTVVKEYP